MDHVYVALYEKFGIPKLRVFTNEARAWYWRNEIAMANWEKNLVPGITPSMLPGDIGETYFAVMCHRQGTSAEHFLVEKCEVEGMR